MSAAYLPFGLQAVYHPSGSLRIDEVPVASAYGANIYTGSPVQIAYASGNQILAAAGSRIAGVFAGCEFTRPDGSIFVGPYFPTGATYVAGTCKAYIQGPLGDTETIFRVQANATLTAAAIGKVYDWTTNATANGSTTTGISDVGLDVASGLTTEAAAGLVVVGLSREPDNAWGDAYPIVLVKMAEAQFGSDIIQFVS